MNETSPSNGNANQSSCVSNKNPESKVPIDGDKLAIETTNNITNKDDKKVPSCSEVLSNVSDVKLYESSISDSCNNEQNNKLKQNNHCDQAKMSPVEGPVNEMPKTMFDNKSHEKQSSDHSSDPGGCEQFSGQIVYNPDGSAYIMEENDDSLLEQIPKQEGSIVEKGGKCLSEVEYPKIDQAVYIERRKAWYNAMGSAYLQFLQGGKSPESPQVHNFRVVSVKEKITSKERRDEDSSEGKSPDNELCLSYAPHNCRLYCGKR